MISFELGMCKAAAEKDESEKHYVRRGLIGNHLSAAVEAKKGKKLKALKETAWHALKETGKGAIGGAGLGALAGLGVAALKKKHLGSAAGIGANVGASLGGTIGRFKGHFDDKASELHGKYSKHKKD